MTPIFSRSWFVKRQIVSVLFSVRDDCESARADEQLADLECLLAGVRL
jgi:hypothetical protein